jgi:hypothetical protein
MYKIYLRYNAIIRHPQKYPQNIFVAQFESIKSLLDLHFLWADCPVNFESARIGLAVPV